MDQVTRRTFLGAVTVAAVQKGPRLAPNMVGRHEQRICGTRESTGLFVVRVAPGRSCDPVRRIDEDHRRRFGP